MLNFTLSLLCLGFALVGVVARKTYYSLPDRELKRRAKGSDAQAEQLYQAVSYGRSLRALLWLWISLSGAIGLVLLVRTTSAWFSFVLVVISIWIVFSWLPASRATSYGRRVTLAVNPAVVWTLRHLHPLLARGAERVERRYSAPAHTGLYDRTDILDLITQQSGQPDSRLSIEELAIVQRALTFGDYQVRDIVTPRVQIQTVKADAVVGPVLIDELHRSLSPYVIALEKSGAVTGSVAVQQLGLHSEGVIRDHLNGPVYFLHESDSLREALHAFFVTNSPLFIVINSFEEYVGIITVESIIRQLLGHLPGDDFEQYADQAAVAARHPKATKSGQSSHQIEKPAEPA